MNKKIIILSVAVLVLVGVAYWMFGKQSSTSNVSNDAKEQNTSQDDSPVKTVEVDKNEFPDKYPQDIPVEPDYVVIQNYNATTDDGRFQATRVYRINQSLTQAYATYQTYLRENRWDIASTVNSDTYKMLFATNAKGQLQIEMDQNVQSNERTVSVSYTEQQ
ncbi:MAG: hypothetical protein R3B41_02425 [Candidatus Doudnabacteria bacterium]